MASRSIKGFDGDASCQKAYDLATRLLADQIRQNSGFRGQFDMYNGPLLIAPVSRSDDLIAVRVFANAHQRHGDVTGELTTALEDRLLPFKPMEDGSLAVEITTDRLRSELKGMCNHSTPIEHLLHALATKQMLISEIVRAVGFRQKSDPRPLIQA